MPWPAFALRRFSNRKTEGGDAALDPFVVDRGDGGGVSRGGEAGRHGLVWLLEKLVIVEPRMTG